MAKGTRGCPITNLPCIPDLDHLPGKTTELSPARLPTPQHRFQRGCVSRRLGRARVAVAVPASRPLATDAHPGGRAHARCGWRLPETHGGQLGRLLSHPGPTQSPGAPWVRLLSPRTLCRAVPTPPTHTPPQQCTSNSEFPQHPHSRPLSLPPWGLRNAVACRTGETQLGPFCLSCPPPFPVLFVLSAASPGLKGARGERHSQAPGRAGLLGQEAGAPPRLRSSPQSVKLQECWQSLHEAKRAGGLGRERSCNSSGLCSPITLGPRHREGWRQGEQRQWQLGPP